MVNLSNHLWDLWIWHEIDCFSKSIHFLKSISNLAFNRFVITRSNSCTVSGKRAILRFYIESQVLQQVFQVSLQNVLSHPYKITSSVIIKAFQMSDSAVERLLSNVICGICQLYMHLHLLQKNVLFPLFFTIKICKHCCLLWCYITALSNQSYLLKLKETAKPKPQTTQTHINQNCCVSCCPSAPQQTHPEHTPFSLPSLTHYQCHMSYLLHCKIVTNGYCKNNGNKTTC